ncbi:methionyl-tRNA formyltransferase [Blattabacterium cuenoti]|uniref:methionyl-tRNA formyltransferase n=1 Tax=Blattabacterium cuenoti TaxID=1653831 RepID=UPI00163CC030|nr:methionyl-tRNA formyltransferase [Blattabacterium cuenoti]
MKKFPKIVFIGSNNFSVYSLKELYKQYNNNIIGIITVPDNPIYIGKKSFSPVKKYALDNNIPFLQPNNLNDPKFFRNFKKWNSDIQIVVSFRILPEKIWNFPKMGTINLHGSLLPQYKGAAPINWAIINGENKTGITIFFIEKKIDSGKILLQKKIFINQKETAGDIENKMIKISGKMLISAIEKVFNRDIVPISQNDIYIKDLKKAPKIYTEDCRIKWKNNTIGSIYNKIRGLSPYPTAWTFFIINKNKYLRFKIFIIEKIEKYHSFKIGKVIITSSKIMIAVKSGLISIIEGQIEGKKRMNVKNIINGFRIKNNIFVE